MTLEMNIRKSFRRLLGMMLCAAMLVTCIPTSAFAEEIIDTAEITTEIQKPEAETPADEGKTTVEESMEASPSETAVPEASLSETIVLEAEASDGVKVKLTADKDAFEADEGLELKAEVVTKEDAVAAEKEIDKVEDAENVAKRVTYDIRVEKDGEELQPLEGKSVKVEFILSDVPSGADDVTIYHHDEEEGLEVIAEEKLTEAAGTVNTDGMASSGSSEAAEETDEEELAEIEDEEIINDLNIVGETDSFSLYTVDFTYNDKTVRIPGETEKNPLECILEGVGITDTIMDVEVYSDDEFKVKSDDGVVRNGDSILFRVYNDDGTWYVDAVNAFSTTHGIIVKTAEADYRVKVTDEPITTPNYLTFIAQEDNSSVTFNWTSGSNVQYSLNGGEWKSYTEGTKINLSNEQKVRFRGNNVVTSYNDHFSMTGTIAASGSVTSLTDSNGGDPNVTLADSCYSNMFFNCRVLTTAPELPATTLAASCYSHMFCDCIGLTTAPELPATTLADSCYSNMFSNCSKLTTAPELPATTLVSNCYVAMFYKCRGLTEAPELPATTLASCCYSSMFYKCTGLTEAPELPATTLADSCYIYMFFGCTGLTTAPELPATTLTVSCYWYMFSDCTGLTSAPELPATTLATSCYNSMFADCTGLISAPELPATTLAAGCYRSMFYGCTGLTSAPELPATTLATNCYASMFADCTGLTSAPELPATTLADGCYNYMFSYCTSLNIYEGPGEGLVKLINTESGNTESGKCDGMLNNTKVGEDGTLRTTTIIPHVYYIGEKTAASAPTEQTAIKVSDTYTTTWANGNGGSWVYEEATDTWRYRLYDGTYVKNNWMYLTQDGKRIFWHFDENGKMQEGWFRDTDGSWYFLSDIRDSSRGSMQIGWHIDPQDGKIYYFDTDGKMATGWKKIDGVWYYFTPQGAASAASWSFNKVTGQWECTTVMTHPLGSMWTNATTPDGYPVGADGALLAE